MELALIMVSKYNFKYQKIRNIFKLLGNWYPLLVPLKSDKSIDIKLSGWNTTACPTCYAKVKIFAIGYLI